MGMIRTLKHFKQASEAGRFISHFWGIHKRLHDTGSPQYPGLSGAEDAHSRIWLCSVASPVISTNFDIIYAEGSREFQQNTFYLSIVSEGHTPVSRSSISAQSVASPVVGISSFTLLWYMLTCTVQASQTNVEQGWSHSCYLHREHGHSMVLKTLRNSLLMHTDLREYGHLSREPSNSSDGWLALLRPVRRV